MPNNVFDRMLAMNRLPTHLKDEHDRVMATAPIPYRDGYTVQPVSYAYSPWYTTGFHYWGWIIVRDDCNIGPGCIWFHTAEEAKKGIDLLYEAGGHPVPKWDEVCGKVPANHAWVKKFWELVRREWPPCC